MLFSLFVTLLVIQRIAELFIAKNNEKWMKANGGIEVGKEHYKYMVLMHILFFISLLFEVISFEKSWSSMWPVFLLLFLCAQVLRGWSLFSLGRFWNTKIIILPNVNVISNGPYRYIRHPNYLVVMIEFLVIPLLFNAFGTAIIFTVLNMMILSIRIPMEERALSGGTNYSTVFGHRSRFTPSKQRP